MQVIGQRPEISENGNFSLDINIIGYSLSIGH